MPKGPEYELQSQIAQLAHILGWETIAFRPAMTKRGMRTPGTGSMAKGWPDMTLVRTRDRRIIFAELKSNVGKLSPDQERVIDVLTMLTADGMIRSGVYPGGPPYEPTRVEVHVWRPRDFDQIEQALR